MAQYKVPQDVEADDKLLGPFSFRQFVYLLIAGGCIALAVAFFQLFPLLAIIPILPALFFIILALPLKKDQPMETYLAAIVSYYLKPRTRIWLPGQRESTISVTAPKVIDDDRTRDITGEEATHRLSFLADIVDTGGYAIKNNNTQVSDEVVAEANTADDMFETMHFDNLEDTIAKDENARHEEVMKEMREAIQKNESLTHEITKRSDEEKKKQEEKTDMKADEDVDVKPVVAKEPVEKPEEKVEQSEKKVEEPKPKPSIIELANNADYSVATIAKEANRIKERDEGEVFISLH